MRAPDDSKVDANARRAQVAVAGHKKDTRSGTQMRKGNAASVSHPKVSETGVYERERDRRNAGGRRCVGANIKT